MTPCTKAINEQEIETQHKSLMRLLTPFYLSGHSAQYSYSCAASCAGLTDNLTLKPQTLWTALVMPALKRMST